MPIELQVIVMVIFVLVSLAVGIAITKHING